MRGLPRLELEVEQQPINHTNNFKGPNLILSCLVVQINVWKIEKLSETYSYICCTTH